MTLEYDDDDKLDLSGLDPVADPRRLDFVAESIARRAITARRAGAARKHKSSLWGTLVAYSRWAAAFSVATAAAVLFLMVSTPASPDLPEDDPADVVMLSWAEGDAEPTADDILQVLGDEP